MVEIINDLMLVLNEKEKRTISGRFGFSGKRETLSAIGRELGLSRERVRQIEKNALQKISALLKKKYAEMISLVEKSFQNNGGIIIDENIPAELLGFAKNHKFAGSYIRLFCTIDQELRK